ncbi:VOC family protein [Kribbella sp. WER1]
MGLLRPGPRRPDRALHRPTDLVLETTRSQRRRLGGHHLRYGGTAITLFTDEHGHDRPACKGDTVGHGLYFAFDTQAEVDAVYARATAAGAEPVWTPELSEWGNYRCRGADPEGYEWTFGTHRPGQ